MTNSTCPSASIRCRYAAAWRGQQAAERDRGGQPRPHVYPEDAPGHPECCTRTPSTGPAASATPPVPPQMPAARARAVGSAYRSAVARSGPVPRPRHGRRRRSCRRNPPSHARGRAHAADGSAQNRLICARQRPALTQEEAENNRRSGRSSGCRAADFFTLRDCQCPGLRDVAQADPARRHAHEAVAAQQKITVLAVFKMGDAASS